MTDAELLARIIKCEAGGEGDDGMRAVASVIMNRYRTLIGEYGKYNSLYETLFAPSQFECAMTGQPQNLYNMSPEQIHYDIAEWAIAGGRFAAVEDSLWFFNPYSYVCPPTFPSLIGSFLIRIGEHCFYSPTPAYAQT